MNDHIINSAGIQYVRDHLAHFPRPDLDAKRALRDWASNRGITLDPDQVDVVTLHYRPDGAQGYQAVITQRMSLTQALLGKWQGESDNDFFGSLFGAPWAGHFPAGPLKIVNRLPQQPVVDNSAAYGVFNGVFQRTQPARFDPSTYIKLPIEELQRFIDDSDFHAYYTQNLDIYWRVHAGSHRLSCKLAFIAACNKQVAEGSLSDAARKLAWRAAGLMPRGRGIRLSTLTVYGYASTDLLYMNDARSDLTLLYIPGNSSPLLEFASEVALKDWFGEQCKDPVKRQALKQHFNLADLPDGLDFSGLETALSGLGDYPAIHRLSSNRPGFTTDGRWSPRDYVNYRPGKYNPKLTGDLFEALTQRQKERSYADADFIITSNSELTKAKWRGYLNSALNLLMPLTFVVPELAPLLALGGVAQLSLGLDQAINGKTSQEKAEAVSDIAYGLFNASPLAVGAVAKGSGLLRFEIEGFVPPSRINDQWGYPLSPMNAPRLPEVEAAQFFHFSETIEPLDAIAPFERPVTRKTRYDGQPDHLQALTVLSDGEVKELNLIYDVDLDLFFDSRDVNEVDPPHYRATVGTPFVDSIDPATHLATNASRTATLRTLGVDLPLPAQIPVPVRGLQPIPKTLSSLWIGDKAISEKLIENLGNNVKLLKNSGYEYRLFLSNNNPTVYAENVSQLSRKAPDLVVLPLEEQPFFNAFKQSRYFEQYQAAVDGNGGVATNFSSASDVLRYPMLHHEGGLYMDVDDEVLTPGSGRFGCIGFGACAAQPIEQVTLATTEDGLLLQPAMSNQRLGMNQQYNTSMIGSHAGNPTLVAISDEMHARYQTNRDFYQSRPNQAEDPSGFSAYAKRLNRLTGPGLVTDVIDRLLPDLYRLRQFRLLYSMAQTNANHFVDLSAWAEAELELLPLSRFARVGGLHSWTHT